MGRGRDSDPDDLVCIYVLVETWPIWTCIILVLWSGEQSRILDSLKISSYKVIWYERDCVGVHRKGGGVQLEMSTMSCIFVHCTYRKAQAFGVFV